MFGEGTLFPFFLAPLLPLATSGSCFADALPVADAADAADAAAAAAAGLSAVDAAATASEKNGD